ncbi:hypothetical protein [Streptomyces sp. Agncl-13]|uniref:hypothetical protein n=1 Tax=Streptomyces sp. Agncl-13 TaxID=3400628 RepID=UPI003A8A84D6
MSARAHSSPSCLDCCLARQKRNQLGAAEQSSGRPQADQDTGPGRLERAFNVRERLLRQLAPPVDPHRGQGARLRAGADLRQEYGFNPLPARWERDSDEATVGCPQTLLPKSEAMPASPEA